MSEAKLDLIAKLLAKAESTTPEEAEALTEHAERLMVKYGIEQARLDARRAQIGQTREEITQERMLFTGVYARDIRELGGNVAFALGSIRPMQAEHPGGGMILYFVGFTSDVHQAKILTASLQVQAMVAMRAWWAGQRELYRRHSESEKRRARSGFIRGFGIGASQRLRESRRVIIEESSTGTDVVLASRRDQVDTFFNDIPHVRARARQGADLSAFTHGHRSGRDANTGGKSLTPGRGLPR
ncbi:DUF2786 domain-containing protein [Microbacterium sp. A84]|uniref:DUF2786 domain-containing protein n=1 Tax=Microbacterium sp. A84 TaxID=3450715 RepID=UPI003F438285